LARQTRISGTVIFNVALAEDGTIQRVEVVQGHPLLIDPTKNSLGKWRFEPSSGKPRSFELTLKFELPDVAPNRVRVVVEQPLQIVVMVGPPIIDHGGPGPY
jgi:hypothetical protein